MEPDTPIRDDGVSTVSEDTVGEYANCYSQHAPDVRLYEDGGYDSYYGRSDEYGHFYNHQQQQQQQQQQQYGGFAGYSAPFECKGNVLSQIIIPSPQQHSPNGVAQAYGYPSDMVPCFTILPSGWNGSISPGGQYGPLDRGYPLYFFGGGGGNHTAIAPGTTFYSQGNPLDRPGGGVASECSEGQEEGTALWAGGTAASFHNYTPIENGNGNNVNGVRGHVAEQLYIYPKYPVNGGNGRGRRGSSRSNNNSTRRRTSVHVDDSFQRDAARMQPQSSPSSSSSLPASPSRSPLVSGSSARFAQRQKRIRSQEGTTIYTTRSSSATTTTATAQAVMATNGTGGLSIRQKLLNAFMGAVPKTKRCGINSLYVFKCDTRYPPIVEFDPEFIQFCNEILDVVKYPPSSIVHKIVSLRKIIPTKRPISSATVTNIAVTNRAAPKEGGGGGDGGCKSAAEVTKKEGIATAPAEPLAASLFSPGSHTTVDYHRICWVVLYPDHKTAVEVGKNILEKDTVFMGDPVYCKWAFNDPFFS